MLRYCAMNTTPYHRYQYADGTAGGAGQKQHGDEDHYVYVNRSWVAARLKLVAMPLRLRQQQELMISIQHDQAPLFQYTHSEPLASASGQPQFYHTSSGQTADGFATQTHCLQLQPAIHPYPYMQQEHYSSVPVPVHVKSMRPSPSAASFARHVQVQVQAFSRDTLERSTHFQRSAAGAGPHSSHHTHECPTKSPQGKGRGKELFVCNLPCSFTEEEVRAMFSTYGIVTRASIARCEKGKSKGYAFVKFKLQSSADNAIAHLNLFEIRGKTLHLDYSDAKQSKTQSHR